MALTFRQMLVAGAIAVLSLLAVSMFGVILAMSAAANRSQVLITNGSSSSSGPNFGILTQGEATVSKQPDIAFISMGVSAQEATATAAQQALATKANKLIAAAKAVGAADKDISTGGYSIGPNYILPDYTQINGYRASEQLNVKWHNVTTVGKALDALVQQGGATVVSASFGLSDPKAAQAEARTLAIQDARSRAEAMATAARVKLGSVLRVSDLSAPSIFLPTARAADSSQTQLPVGTIDVSVSVEVDFAIAG